MEKKNSTKVIALGLGVFVVGGALLFILLSGSGSAKKSVVATPVSATGAPLAAALKAATGGPVALPIKIPQGQAGFAVQMDYFGGGGGYVQPGDQVNIYAIVNKTCEDPKNPLVVKLVQSNVKVLGVVSQAPGQAGQPTAYLLAVNAQQAEQLIFLKTADALYFTLTSDKDPAVATSGMTCTNAL